MAERELDEYKDVKFYAKHTTAKQAGFSKFNVDKDFYFCRYIDGNIAMLSQAYTSVAGRDNGIESVKKNEKQAKRFKFESRGGTGHGFSLRAGNGQEIAISPDYASLGRAQQVTSRLTGSATASSTKSAAPKKKAAVKPRVKKVAAPKARTTSHEQNYLPVAAYRKATKGKTKGFETFKGDDGEYYFTYFENGKLALISEGYPTAAIRDVGQASVEKNMKIEKRYVFGKGAEGKEGFILRAGNHKEIARSVGYGSATAATAGAAYLMGTRRRAKPTAAKPAVRKAAPAKAAKVKPVAKPKPKPVKKAVKKPAVKKPKSIAPLAAGGVAIAGLGAAAAAKAAPAKKSTPVKKAAVPVRAAKPKPIKKPVAKPVAKKVKSIAPLAAGGVAVAGLGAAAAAAKSTTIKKAAVPVKAAPIKAAPVKAAPIKAAPVAAPIAAAAVASVAAVAAVAATPKAAVPPKAAPVTAAAVKPVVAAAIPAAATPAAAGGGGIWGWLKWLLLGLLALLAILFLVKACAGGGKDIKAPIVDTVKPAAAPAAMVTCWNGSKAKNDQACPTKITCWDDSFATRQSACPVQPVAKEFACWDGSMATDQAGCPVEVVAKATVSPTPRSVVANQLSATPTSGRFCGPSSNRLFNVTSSRPKSVAYLGSNPQFGESLSLTPEGFYRKLATAYRTNSSDRAFLNLVARSLGYNSFKDMDASMFSNDTLPNGTSGMLGFGSQHALQFSSLNVTDATNLEAFKVRSANGTDVHFMKRCGNFMYVCQP